jgi:ATP-dependent Clp protease ATP-binding subunit ClpA
MSLDPKQFTEKTAQVLVTAQDLARESSHVELTPLHLMKALLDDQEVSCLVLFFVSLFNIRGCKSLQDSSDKTIVFAIL